MKITIEVPSDRTNKRDKIDIEITGQLPNEIKELLKVIADKINQIKVNK